MNKNFSKNFKEHEPVYMDLDAQSRPRVQLPPNNNNFFEVHSFVPIMSDSDISGDTESLASYRDDETASIRTSTPADFDFGPKRNKNKERTCTKHAYHTPEQLQKCLTLMEKNRIASLKSRQKKISTIGTQAHKINEMKKDLHAKTLLIQKIMKEKNDLAHQLSLMRQKVDYFSKGRSNQSEIECWDMAQNSGQNGTEPEGNKHKLDDLPASYQNFVWNLINKNTPELDRAVHQVLNAPMEHNNKPKETRPMLFESTTTKIYAQKPTCLNIDDSNEPQFTVEKTTVYKSPDLERILETFYPIQSPSTSQPTMNEKDNQ